MDLTQRLERKSKYKLDRDHEEAKSQLQRFQHTDIKESSELNKALSDKNDISKLVIEKRDARKKFASSLEPFNLCLLILIQLKLR